MHEGLATNQVDLSGHSLLLAHPAVTHGDLPKQYWVSKDELISHADLASAELAERRPRYVKTREEYDAFVKQVQQRNPNTQLGTYEEYLDANRNPLYEITLTFSSSGKFRFAQVTRQNYNRQLAIVVDGQVISAPIIREEIKGGVAVITGKFSKDVAEQIIRKINGE